MNITVHVVPLDIFSIQIEQIGTIQYNFTCTRVTSYFRQFVDSSYAHRSRSRSRLQLNNSRSRSRLKTGRLRNSAFNMCNTVYIVLIYFLLYKNHEKRICTMQFA